jgi:hypothetical protein
MQTWEEEELAEEPAGVRGVLGRWTYDPPPDAAARWERHALRALRAAPASPSYPSL